MRWFVGDVASLGLEQLPYGLIRQIREHGRIPLIDIGTVGLIRQGAIGVRPLVLRVPGSPTGMLREIGIEARGIAAAIAARG